MAAICCTVHQARGAIRTPASAGRSRANAEEPVDGEPFRTEPLEPLTDDTGLLPPPDPKQFVTYDGSQGPAKPGDARGAYAQGAQNVVGKLKDALTPDN